MFEILGHILPLLVSTFGSAMAVHMKNKAQDNAEQMKLMSIQNTHQIKYMKAQTELIKSDKYFAFTRRLLAIGFAVGFFVVIWILPAVFDTVGYIYEVPGKSWLFGLFKDTTQFEVIKGIPIITVETLNYTIQAIVGLYFGQSMMKR